MTRTTKKSARFAIPRRSAWLWLGASLASSSVATTSPAQPPTERAPAVVDLRVGLEQTLEAPARNLWQGMGQGGIVQLRQGHVIGVLVPFGPSRPDSSAAELALRFTRFRGALAATQAFDARACARPSARIASWFELEAPDLLASDPDSVATWVSRGVRVVSLVDRADSALATSAFPSGGERVVGLTAAGRRVVEAALRAGALVDVKSSSDATVLEVLELAKSFDAKVIATRASARAVLARPGSLSDWQLRAIARSGGLVALSLERELIGSGADAELSDVVRQVEHLRKVAGPDAIALASGYETGGIPAAPLKSAPRFPRLVEALRAAGIEEQELQKLLSGNARRVLCGASARAG